MMFDSSMSVEFLSMTGALQFAITTAQAFVLGPIPICSWVVSCGGFLPLGVFTILTIET
jgi:hypothetical protein